ncbi:MAG: hypothetical protein R2761_28185 [Acidimicrobiales bacterium]
MWSRDELTSWLRRPDVRWRAGRALLAAAAVGVVAALLGTVAAWLVIGDVDSATAETLDVTIQSLDTLAQTIDTADATLTATSASLQEVETTLGSVSASFTTGGAAIDSAAGLTGAVEPSLRDAAATLRQLETLAGTIDTLLAVASRLPLAPSYDPDNGLAPGLGRLAGDLEPLPDQLASTSTSLDEFSGSITTLQTDLSSLTASIHAVNESLAGSHALLDGYRTTVADASAAARATRADFRRDHTLLRLAIVLAGVNLMGVQLAPAWIGLHLLAEEPAAGGATPRPAKRRRHRK